MLAALVRAGRGDRSISDADHGGHLVRLERVSDADPPGSPRRHLAADDYVATAVDAVVPGPGGLEDPSRILERPALDQA